jgi:imidazolonepropionase-like amidohydrolase
VGLLRIRIVITLAAAVCTTTVFYVAALSQNNEKSQSEKIVIYRGATLIDGTGAAPQPAMSVMVRGERIEKIERDADFQVPFGSKVIDVTGLYLVPGLINSHVHLATPPVREWALAMMRRDLYSGVTAERDMADDLRQIADLARAARVGEIPGPDIYYAALMAGPSFFTDPRTHETTRGGAVAGSTPWMRAITPETDLKIAVAEAHGTGATAIKIYADLPEDLVSSITKEAHRQGMLVWAHAAVFPATPAQVIDAGVDVISHVCLVASDPMNSRAEAHKGPPLDARKYINRDNPEIEALFQDMKKRGTILDATLKAYQLVEDEAVKSGKSPVQCSLALAASLTNEAYRDGVEIDAGTDFWPKSYSDPWSSLQTELEVLQNRAGMKPVDVIRAATIAGASTMHLQNEMGTVQPGKLANLVFVSQNPLDNVEAFRSVVLTVKRGVNYWRKDYRPISADEIQRPE